MTDIAAEAREAALHCEGKKHAYRQTQDGVVVSFVLHPQEVPEGLATASLGTRYMLALVAIGDNEEPLEKEPKKQNPLLQRACILCGEEGFQNFLKHTFPMDWGTFAAVSADADGLPGVAEVAADVLRFHCGVRSRKEIVPGSEAAVAFEKLTTLYREWLNQ